jgi:hypothetical protein
MVSRQYGAPLLRGALTTERVARRGEDAATPWSWSTGVGADDQLSLLVGLAALGVISRHEFTTAKARVLRHERWW